MFKLVNRAVGWIDRLTDGVSTLSAWLVVPLFVIMGYEVFALFVLGWPTFWSWELSYMITGSHFVLGIAYVTKTHQHVRVDFIYACGETICRKCVNEPSLLFRSFAKKAKKERSSKSRV